MRNGVLLVLVIWLVVFIKAFGQDGGEIIRKFENRTPRRGDVLGGCVPDMAGLIAKLRSQGRKAKMIGYNRISWPVDQTHVMQVELVPRHCESRGEDKWVAYHITSITEKKVSPNKSTKPR